MESGHAAVKHLSLERASEDHLSAVIAERTGKNAYFFNYASQNCTEVAAYAIIKYDRPTISPSV